MNVLLDMNVVLDVLLNRSPWVADASAVWNAQPGGKLTASVASFTIPTIFYIVRRQHDLTHAIDAVRCCIATLQIAPVGRATLELAQQQPGADFEDNVQIACAIEGQLDAIVTRDPVDFAHSPIPVLTPAQLLAQLAQRHSTPNP